MKSDIGVIACSALGRLTQYTRKNWGAGMRPQWDRQGIQKRAPRCMRPVTSEGAVNSTLTSNIAWRQSRPLSTKPVATEQHRANEG